MELREMVIETRVTRPAVANHCRNPGQIYILIDTDVDFLVVANFYQTRRLKHDVL